jgi:hypothetical protein
MTQTVNIKGKSYPLDKVVTISGLGPKGTFTKEDTKMVIGLHNAPASDAVNKIIYIEFEGKKIVVLKPIKLKDYGPDEVPEGAEYTFLTNTLIKKLSNSDNAIIDTSPINTFNDRRNHNDGFNNRRNYGDSHQRRPGGMFDSERRNHNTNNGNRRTGYQ